MTVRDILSIVALALMLMPIICFGCSVVINTYFARKELHMKKVATDESFWMVEEGDNDGDT